MYVHLLTTAAAAAATTATTATTTTTLRNLLGHLLIKRIPVMYKLSSTKVPEYLSHK